jgi:hypothetical protein
VDPVLVLALVAGTVASGFVLGLGWTGWGWDGTVSSIWFGLLIGGVVYWVADTWRLQWRVYRKARKQGE